ncbi:unnamed protein product, partial [Staurois parvus]
FSLAQVYLLLPFSLAQVYRLLPFSLAQVYLLLPFSLAQVYRLLPFSLAQVYRLLPFSLAQVYRLLPFSLAQVSWLEDVQHHLTLSSPARLSQASPLSLIGFQFIQSWKLRITHGLYLPRNIHSSLLTPT